MTEHDKTIAAVKDYYGAAVAGARDLATKACCCREAMPPSHQAILAEIDPEILDRFYGCGSPIPPFLDGCTALDLGSAPGATPISSRGWSARRVASLAST